MSNIDGKIQQIIKNTSNNSLIEGAFEFAKKAHLGQKRFSGQDYIIHPLSVAQTLAAMRLDSPTVAAGFLHDVPDDTTFSFGEIEKEFGKEVSFLVEGVSKLGKLRYPKSGLTVRPIKTRIEEPVDFQAENLRKMFFAMAKDIRVVLIKLADRLHNMETLNYLPQEKQKRIALETLEIFAPLANRLGMGEMKGQLEDLAFPYLYPKEFNWLIKNVKEKYEERKKHLQKVRPVLIKALEKEGIKPIDVHSRAKHYWSLYQKLLGYDMNFEKIYDIVALRVILKDVETCYKALGIIHKRWKPLPGLIKDYIAFPKPNTYRGVHTTCFCLEGAITEIQIKTPDMHSEAEYGIASHWAYKEGIDLSVQRKKFAWVAQLSNWQKEIPGTKEFLEGLRVDFFKNRIFVLTPKGDVIDIPELATTVDFAYAVHTEVGNRCGGAKINGKIAPLSHPLKNGDIVEIITDKNKKPSRDWLEFVKTNAARSRIKNWLKRESRPENLNRGLTMLNRETQQIKGISWEDIPQNQKENLLKIFIYNDLEGLLVAVGQGEISPKEILKSLFKEREIFALPAAKPLPRIKKKPTDVSLAGETGILINLAKCCLPQPRDEIKAYITKNQGASIHKIGCENMQKSQKKWPQKIIEAYWPEHEKVLYPVSLKIKSDDRLGLFRDISSAISALGINILALRAESQPIDDWAIIEAEVEISGLEELDKLFGQLREIKGVVGVRKT